MSSERSEQRRLTLLLLGLVTVLGYFTYVHGYSFPPAFFWDENYHVASAQKYLNRVFFMEQHPPLGKLLIAAGEKLLDRNPVDDHYIGTDYGTNLPADFSFAGYRFFPVILAWLTAPVLFGIFLLLTRSAVSASLLSMLYVLDNALNVHLRGAMLEPPLLFFSMLTVLAFLLLLAWKDDPRRRGWASLLFGASFAAVLTTKVVGLIFALLVPALIWFLWSGRRIIPGVLGRAAAGFILVYVVVWQTHFALGSTVNPVLPDAGVYQASPEYQAVVAAGQHTSIRWFPLMLKDSLKFVKHYNAGVPRLDLCKEEENGSPWFLWPFGGRSISYRWETPDGERYRYLYLQANPVVWGLGLLGVLLGAALVLSSLLLPLREPLRNPRMLITFLALYGGYMAAISQIDRVMYLYHYFVPLLFSFILFALAVMEIRHVGRRIVTENMRAGFLLVCAALVFAGYQVYMPLSTYRPLTDAQVQRRALLSIWELRCVRCERESVFVE